MDAKLYSKKSETHKRITKKKLYNLVQEVEWQEAKSKERYMNELHPGIFPDQLLRMSQIC